MLSLHYPEVKNILQQHAIGLLTLRTPENKIILVLKMSKEILLAMKLCNGFKISFVKYPSGEQHAHAILTLIYDNPNEPLSLSNTFYDNPESKELIELLDQEEFQVYGFDEHNREFFGQTAKISDFERFREIKSTLVPGNPQPYTGSNFKNLIDQCYLLAENNNDKHTFSIDFASEIYSEPTHFIDTTQLISSPSSEIQPLHYSLERAEPGGQQEIDIFLLLQQIFLDSDIFLNPIRLDNSEEFVDIFVITDDHALLIQAKDSPNTASSLATLVDRKKRKTIGHLEKAIRQLKGAITHAKQKKLLKFKLKDKILEVDLLERKIIGLAIVKELFNEDLRTYTTMLMEAYESTGAPCSVLSYMELYDYSRHVDNHTFFDVLSKLHAEGVKNGVIPQVEFRRE